MEFIQTLIEQTKSGQLDGIWKYNDGGKTYSYNLIKHPLNGLSFDAILKSKNVVFPNGFVLVCKINELKELKKEIDIALKRYVISIIKETCGDNNT